MRSRDARRPASAAPKPLRAILCVAVLTVITGSAPEKAVEASPVTYRLTETDFASKYKAPRHVAFASPVSPTVPAQGGAEAPARMQHAFWGSLWEVVKLCMRNPAACKWVAENRCEIIDVLTDQAHRYKEVIDEEGRRELFDGLESLRQQLRCPRSLSGNKK
jgi:hypothetical protein